VRVDRLTYVGHATTLIEVDGVTLLTDPVLRDRIGHIPRIAAPVAAGPRPDAILISHAHRDHLDLPSLRRLGSTVPVFAPPAVAEILRRQGRPVTELVPGRRARVGALEIAAVEAAHDGRRIPVGHARQAIGFLIDGTVRVYFAGDTDLFGAMDELGGLDVALIPVWGWGPSLGEGHLDPPTAARAAALLRPRVAVPIHWGTYRRIGVRGDAEALQAPADDFVRFARELAPATDVRIVPVGGTLELSTPSRETVTS
jgi:L-ascorbate metabolism protein UlaG (beta-lactamase superfamily)